MAMIVSHSVLSYGKLLHHIDVISAINVTVDSKFNCSKGNYFIYHFLKQCIISPLEWSSFAVGILSLMVWTMVLLPQIYKNHKDLASTTSVSWGLLICWFCGDACNMVGAVITNQGFIQELIGSWFVLTDLVFLMQKVYHDFASPIKLQSSWVPSHGSLVLCVTGMMTLAVTCRSLSFPPPSAANHHHLGRTLLSVDNDRLLFLSTSAVLESTVIVVAVSGNDAVAASLPGVCRCVTQSGFAGIGMGNVLDVALQNTANTVGFAIGILSCIFYTCSRIFQIYKNYKERAVSGLHRLTFVMTVLGNTLYGLAIVLYSVDTDYLIQHGPWIYGSWGIVCFDACLIYQVEKYQDVISNILHSPISIDGYSTSDDDDTEASVLLPNLKATEKYDSVI